MKRLSILFILIALTSVTSCDLSSPHTYTNPNGSITISGTVFNYNEEITVELTTSGDSEEQINIAWTLNGQDVPFTIINEKSFTFTLTPDETTNYTISAEISDSKETITISKDFVVSQLPFLGTWRASNVDTPPYRAFSAGNKSLYSNNS